jgi:hypothetical protein
MLNQPNFEKENPTSINPELRMKNSGSIEDQIDWKIIDQIHAETMNFSKTSLELKKLFFLLISIAVPSLFKISGDRVELSLFITLYLLSITFWSLDSFTYFYQEKLRLKMDQHFTRIRNRNADVPILSETSVDQFSISNNSSPFKKIKKSVFNPSVQLYLVVVVLNTIATLVYLLIEF